MPSSHLILCRPLLLLPPILPSIRVFSNESTLCMRWSKYWSFSLSIIPSTEHPGLISFRMDWLDLLAVQGTLKRRRLLRSLYAGQEATVRTGHGTIDLFQIGKGVRQGCILSPCLFNLYSEYIMSTPQFKRINSLALSFLHSPTLTSIHDHRKNHSLD